MKKVLISALMAAGLISAAGTAMAADSGTITFQGSIVNSACSIAGSDTNKIVPMGSIATHEFAGTGTRNSTGAPFTISLVDCDITIAETASISFTPGAGSVVDNRLLGLENAAGAQGVAIALFDGANEPIVVGGTGTSYTLVNGTNQFNFTAFYEATDTTVTAGPANGKAIFTVNYV